MRVRTQLLVVESASVIRGALSAAARSAGLGVDVASDLSEAFACMGDELPAAIVSATEIGVFSGLSILAALRASVAHRSVPVAFVTSRPDLIGAGSWRGCPVLEKSPGLERAASSWLASLGFGGDQNGSGESPMAGRRILVAEDMDAMRRLIAHRLHARGAQVVIASDGLEASVLALAEPFDLIVLDIEMPRLDGRDAIRLMRDAGVRTRVCALTAHDDSDIVRRLREVDGFDAVIAKPEAVSGIERVLGARAA